MYIHLYSLLLRTCCLFIVRRKPLLNTVARWATRRRWICSPQSLLPRIPTPKDFRIKWNFLPQRTFSAATLSTPHSTLSRTILTANTVYSCIDLLALGWLLSLFSLDDACSFVMHSCTKLFANLIKSKTLRRVSSPNLFFICSSYTKRNTRGTRRYTGSSRWVRNQ
jgi:hypothetical protein